MSLFANNNSDVRVFFNFFADKLMKKGFLIALFLITIYCGFYLFVFSNGIRKSNTIIENANFISFIPIEKCSEIEIPCVNLKIEDKIFSVEIDLGFRGCLALFPQILEQISDKTLVGNTERYGFRGIQHSYPVYSIPQFEIGDVTFSKVNVLEESEEIYEEAVVTKNKEETLSPEQGKLGWNVFTLFNLLLDCKNGLIAFCNSTEMLKKHGYHMDTFAKAPLFLDDGFVEFTAETEQGPLRCILDTGCTLNIMNKNIEGDPEDLLLDPKHLIRHQFLKVDHLDLGPIIFRSLPVKIPVHIEAFLGMEFIKDTRSLSIFRIEWYISLRKIDSSMDFFL